MTSFANLRVAGRRGPNGAIRRILVVCSQFPYPPTNGLALRVWAVLRSLAKNGHEVSLLTFGSPEPAQRHMEPVLRVCRTVEVVPHRQSSLSGAVNLRGRLAALATGLPYAARASKSAGLRSRIETHLAKGDVDAVLCEETQQLVNIPDPLPVPLIVDNHNAEFVLLRRYVAQERNPVRLAYARLEAGRVRNWEQSACRRADVSLVCSEVDRRTFAALSPTTAFAVVPNVVEIGPRLETSSLSEKTVLYTGGMDWYPNRDAVLHFTRSILPRLRGLVPGVRFVVAGRAPGEDFRRRLQDAPDLHFTGFVPDMRDELAAATVCVVPLRIGSGTRLKILEAAAMGKAIVSTTVGAEGLEFVPGREISIADDPGEFAGEAAGLLLDADRRSRLGSAARRRVETSYSLDAMRSALDASIRMVERKRS